MSNKPLNVGLVGGGRGAFIVNPHQKAIHFDGTRRVVAGALFLLWSGQARPRPGSVVRAMGWLNIFAVFVGIFDYLFKTDYMYLCAKPQAASLLDVLGPWPWYIAAAEVGALGAFLLLYLPYRKAAITQP